ncbi:hypothetical protein QEN19_002246 [Hanseniaspora menglaensis]
MSSNTYSDVQSTKLQSNVFSDKFKSVCFNDQNIQINVAYANGKPLQLKNVILKAEEQVEFNKTVLIKKESTYSLQKTFKWLEYVDPRKIPVAMMGYFKTRYDVVTTSKLTSQFFLEKLIKQQRYMLAYNKSLGKYLLIYYKLNIDYEDGNADCNLNDILHKLEIKAVEINIANMLIEVYKNKKLIFKQSSIIKNEIKSEFEAVTNSELNYNENDLRHYSTSLSFNEKNAVEFLQDELKDVNMKMNNLMSLNNQLLEQNKIIKEQNDVILKLLKDNIGS